MGALVSRLKNNEYQPLSTQEERLATRQVADTDTGAVVIALQLTMLPQDVLGEISLYLPLQSFSVFRNVCRQFLEGTRRPARINEAFLRVFFVNILNSLSITNNQVTLSIRDGYFYEEIRFLPTDITPSEFQAMPRGPIDNEWLLMSNNQVIMKKIRDAMAAFVAPPNRLKRNLGYLCKRYAVLFFLVAAIHQALFALIKIPFDNRIPPAIRMILYAVYSLGLLSYEVGETIENKENKIAEYYSLWYQEKQCFIDSQIMQLSAGARLFNYVMPPDSPHNNAEEPTRDLLLQ